MNVSGIWCGKHDFSTASFPLLLILVTLTQFFICSSLPIAVSPFAGFTDRAAQRIDSVRHICTIRKQLNGHGSAVGMLV